MDRIVVEEQVYKERLVCQGTHAYPHMCLRPECKTGRFKKAPSGGLGP